MPKVFGQFAGSFSPKQLGKLLSDHGLCVSANAFCVRIHCPSHFKLEICDGTVIVDADADTNEEMIRDAILVSDALSKAGVRHRFEVYDEHDEMIEYFHLGWPR